MLALNLTTLHQVAEQACADAAAHPRWLTAIGRALIELECNPWIAPDPDHDGLLIASPSGNVYSSNGVCQCKAYEHGQPCWHRAAARLVRLHDEAIVRQAPAPLGQRISAARAKAEMAELFN